MTQRRLLPALLLVVLAVPAAAQDYEVTFLDRTVDLEPFFEGFPYSGWNADYASGRLFYFQESGMGRFLRSVRLDTGPDAGRVNPGGGRAMNEIDWSARNFWGMEYDSLRRDYIVLGDERNDEHINLYRLEPDDGALLQLTDVAYVYGWSFSKDYQRIGYIARFGTMEPFRNCLRLLNPGDGSDVRTASERDVLCEQGAPYRMVWSAVNFRPDASGVVLKVNGDGERQRGNLAYVDLTAEQPSMRILLPEDVERFQLATVEEWLDNNRFYYVSDETGYANLYVYDLSAGSSRQVTHLEESASFTPLVIDGRRLLLTRLERPYETVMVVTDPATGAELGRRTFDASVGIAGFDEEHTLFLSMTSAASPFQADELVIGLEGRRVTWNLYPRVRLPESLAAQLEQCDVERVSYPTFDVDPATGQTRMLHAFLMTPKRPLPDPGDRLAVITSFYGGGNSFSDRQQIFCAAGISWLSPAVRGSSGFGKAFGALNDGDLGGDEIIDLFYGARFLQEKLGLEPHQIGVTGGSHGGYATMRALTFPPYTNGRNESYDFGFGISHAGFSSIITFYNATNIPDWVTLEAGDPFAEREKLLDRSPLTHVDRLDAPLLLTHGSNDNRVGVTESRQFAEAAEELGKPVTYVEFEGQGHGIKGRDNLVRWYRVQFGFLEGVVQRNRGGPSARGRP